MMDHQQEKNKVVMVARGNNELAKASRVAVCAIIVSSRLLVCVFFLGVLR